MPHYVLDYESRFREKVIEPFAESYASGETPIPCVACNQHIKFADLFDTARDLGADALATGHYVVSREDTASGSPVRSIRTPGSLASAGVAASPVRALAASMKVSILPAAA